MNDLRLVEAALKEKEQIRDGIDLVRCHLVIPRRAVDRVSRALDDGDLERARLHLEDIETGVEAAYGQCNALEDGTA